MHTQQLSLPLINIYQLEKTVKEEIKVKPKENLGQRGYLNSVTSIIDYAGLQIIGFFVSPFIVNGLGSTMYGAWQMLGQMTGFANMADTRATQVLKWTVSKKRDIATPDELRSEVTSALLITAFILPLVLVFGGVVVWYAPVITRVDEEHAQLIRIVCGILMLALVINKVFDIFEAVLRGMNLGFRRMGVRAGIIAFGGLLKIFVITQGYGLIGLSLVDIVVALITGITFYQIVRKNVDWFGFGKTTKAKTISYGKVSGWFMAFSGTKILLLNSDKILLGYLIGPIYVTQYTITMFATYAVQGLIYAVVNGIIPGIGSLFGKKEFDKVKKARSLINNINWLLIVSIGVAILLFNKSFINLWIGEDHFAGALENLFILLISVQFVFFQTESLIINVSLNLKMKVLLSLIASSVTFVLAYALVRDYHIIGLCWSIFAGRLILTIGYPLILRKQMSDSTAFVRLTILRPLVIALILFIAATYWGQYVFITNWFYLLLQGGMVVLVAGLIFWFAGISHVGRKELLEVASKIKLFKRD